MSSELHLQEKFLIPFFVDTLGYKEVKANTVNSSTLFIEEDLEAFISTTELNHAPYQALLKKYKNDRRQILEDLITLIQDRAVSSRNMALFFNINKTVTLEGIKIHLFYPSGSDLHENKYFHENIFSVVQELSYKYRYDEKIIYSFRPDVSLFLNGIYIGYSELKFNLTNQTARKNGRAKVIKDYFDAVRVFYETFDNNPMFSERNKELYRKDFLKVFERAILISTTDVNETFIIRNIADFFDDVLVSCQELRFDREEYEKKVQKDFKPYPLHNPTGTQQEKLREIFASHYGKLFVEKEILYYNFIEREVHTNGHTRIVKDSKGYLVSPRPKQKFGTDKIMARIEEFLAHEGEDDYFLALLEKQLANVSPSKRHELIEKRKSYSNNKNVYSLLMQYAAGFGKSNIIGWTALQLKDLRKNGEYVYDKIMLIVDRVDLRMQLDAKLLNMNIDNKMYVEAHNKKTFQDALKSDIRLVIVNLQKFGSVREMLDAEVLQKLSTMRIVFLIDEIHRSNSGEQHEEMVNIFDELQSPFDRNENYNATRTKKNLIVGFTATPTDTTLARFGEYSGYAESEKLWVPFDAYTMKEAIADGYILNPLSNIVPVASKMFFELPAHALAGFEEPEYKDIPKKQIYENRERIDAIARYVADLLVKDVYPKIHGTAKAMLAVHSIKAAIAYKDRVTRYFKEFTEQKKYERFANAPIFIVYSENQEEQNATGLNDGLTEKKVIEKFCLSKNSLIIVVAKLQTGFDEKKLHTLFLDKEVRDITAIQTISRVNRTTKHKNDCKIVDFSYDNVNVQNIKDAFEHFSDVVVSDFDPFGEAKLLEFLHKELINAEVYEKFIDVFTTLYNDSEKLANPSAHIDFDQSIKKFIEANPKRTADTKAKVTQYFTILNKIEYVITIDKKYSYPELLQFYRKFNALYNLLNRLEEIRDPIEVYFDNQIGIVEVIAQDTKPKSPKIQTMAEPKDPNRTPHQYSILDIIENRNADQELIGTLIAEFAKKIERFFLFASDSIDGKRLIVKIQSNVSEMEVFEDFGKIYRKYKILRKEDVGEYFFKETSDLLEKLCHDFEQWVRQGAKILYEF